MNRAAILLLVGLTLVGQTRASFAAEEENEPAWYRVEVIVFRYLETEGVSENWPALPALAYPSAVHHLRTGASENTLRQQFTLVQIEDTLAEPAFDLAWNKSIAQLRRDYAFMLEERRALAEAAELEVLEAGIDLADSPVDPLEVTIPDAFVLLDETSKEFRVQAGGIRRSRDMRMMLHRSWLQPLRARDQSLPVLLDGEITAGDFPVLQGSLMLYVSRYLHVETNLWLNTEGNTSDNSPAEWRMPAPPLPPQFYAITPWSFEVELETGFSDDISLLQVVPREPDPVDELQPIVIAARRIFDHQAAPIDVDRFLQQPDYAFEHAVLVQQKRRMRGGELHYLDHPLLGVILRVSPYEFEPFFEPAEVSGEIAGSGR